MDDPKVIEEADEKLREVQCNNSRACGHILLVCCDRRCLLMQTDFEMDIKEGNYDGVRVLGAFYRHADSG